MAEDTQKRHFGVNRELIVLAHPDSFWGKATPPAEGARSGVRSFPADTVKHPLIASVLNRHGARIRPLFAARALHGLENFAAAPSFGRGAVTPVYHRVVADDQALDQIATELRTVPDVGAVYIKPPTEPAINQMVPIAAPLAPHVGTPDFSARQNYLDAAPGGVDARYAWTVAGGKGTGINIVDVEGEWRLDHEDLQAHNRGILAGTPPGLIDWRNHGTAVLGIVNGADNGLGVTAICPEATIGLSSFFGDDRTTSAAIREAADKLQAGDVLLIELHRPGPRYAFQTRDDELGYVAVEWWPDDFDAIQYAVSRGISVVEAAGNGAEDLGDPLYDTPADGFPSDWTNPYNRAHRDSGAIVVGAGAPPPGTHGRNLYGPDRSRLDFSNYGALIDAQGWGREVTTCGYGDLRGGANETVWYTDEFSGTSSASPIVVGVLACLQGAARAAGQAALSPQQARALLRSTGSPQQASADFPTTQRIGNRPDLRALIAAARATS